jgi:hypothetical protein
MLEQKMQDHPVYKQVMADSFNGVMYNVANRGKYDSEELLKIWDSATDGERESVNGIIKGAINFLKGK